MKRVRGSVEAEIQVDKDGTALLPAAILAAMHARPGLRVRVRLSSVVLSRELVARGVCEEEIESIGALQFESRANVLGFLASEGTLSDDKGFRRMARKVGR